MSTATRRLCAIIAPVGLAVAATAVVATGPAAAVVNTVNVKPGLGGNYATTCTYEIRAEVDAPGWVTFKDDGAVIEKVWSDGSAVTTEWTPYWVGTHHITARQPNSPSASANVLVVTGLNLGSLCIPIGG